MFNFRPFLKTLIFSLFVFCSVGVFLPLQAFAASDASYDFHVSSSTISPYDSSVFGGPFSLTVTDDSPFNIFGNQDHSFYSVDVPFIFFSNVLNQSSIDFTLSCTSRVTVTLLFNDVNGYADAQIIYSGSFADSDLLLYQEIFRFSYSGECDGIPTGLRFDFDGFGLVCRNNTSNSLNFNYGCNIRIGNFSFFNVSLVGSGSSSNTYNITENYASQLSNNGFSPLVFAENTPIKAFSENVTFIPSFGSTVFFTKDFSTLTFDGQLNFYAGLDSINKLPVSFLGDTRQGDYEIAFGFISSSNPNPNRLDDIFDYGWSGEYVFDQVGYPLFDSSTDYKVNYRIQEDGNYWYTTVWLRFSIPREFDSLLIRTGPNISNCKFFAFTISKYIGTIADQLVQTQEHWDSQLSGSSAFHGQNQSATSAMSSFESSESNYFSDYETQVQATGIDRFDLAVLADNLYFVKLCIDTVYNGFPDILQYVLFTALVFGAMGAILGTLHYVSKNYSHTRTLHKSSKTRVY